MNCDEFRAAVLAGQEDAEVGAHEAACAACRAQAPEIRSAAGNLGDPALWEEPSPELGRQIEDLIGNAARGRQPRPESANRLGRALGVAAVVVALAVSALVFTSSSRADWEIALPATDLAAGATASVRGWNQEAGTRMVLAVAGLDAAPAGFVYEFWLSEGPIHVSAGTFTGSGEVELWSGVTRAEP